MAALVLHTYVIPDRERALHDTGADRATPTLQGSDGSNGVNTFHNFMCFD